MRVGSRWVLCKVPKLLLCWVASLHGFWSATNFSAALLCCRSMPSTLLWHAQCKALRSTGSTSGRRRSISLLCCT